MRKEKLHIYVTNVEEYLKGAIEWSLRVHHRHDMEGNGWFYAGNFEIELNPDEEAMKNYVLGRIKQEKEEVLAKLELLEIKEKELLSITYQKE